MSIKTTDVATFPPKMQHGYNFGIDLLRATHLHGPKVAFESPQGVATYSHLNHLIICFALNLKKRGVKPGALVALAAMDGPTYFAMLAAVALLGATWVDGTHAALRSGLKITHLVHASTEHRHVAKNEFRLDSSWLQIPDDLDDVSTLAFTGYRHSEAPAEILQSSGSTGTPKFMVATARMIAKRLELRTFDLGFPTERALLLSPVGSAMFVSWCGRNVLLGGRIQIGLGPNSAVAAGTDVIVGSPRQLEAFLIGHVPKKIPQIAIGYVTGAATNRKLRHNLLQFFYRLRVGYGATEVNAGAAQHLINIDNIDSVDLGHPMPWARIEVVDDDHKPLPFDHEGMIRIKTESMVSGYLGRTIAGHSRFHDGWFYPGDIGMLTKDNRLMLVGRIDERLNLDGIKIDAAAVDRKLLELDQVKDCASFVWESGAGTLKLGIAVVPSNSEVDQAALRVLLVRSCIDAFGRNGTPAAIIFVQDLPRNANGKVLRKQLGHMVKETS